MSSALGSWKRILRIAVLITAVTLTVAIWGLMSGREWQTMAFLTLGAMQLSVAIALEADPGPGRIHFFWLPSSQPGFCSLPRCMCRRWPRS